MRTTAQADKTERDGEPKSVFINNFDVVYLVAHLGWEFGAIDIVKRIKNKGLRIIMRAIHNRGENPKLKGQLRSGTWMSIVEGFEPKRMRAEQRRVHNYLWYQNVTR